MSLFSSVKNFYVLGDMLLIAFFNLTLGNRTEMSEMYSGSLKGFVFELLD